MVFITAVLARNLLAPFTIKATQWLYVFCRAVSIQAEVKRQVVLFFQEVLLEPSSFVFDRLGKQGPIMSIGKMKLHSKPSPWGEGSWCLSFLPSPVFSYTQIQGGEWGQVVPGGHRPVLIEYTKHCNKDDYTDHLKPFKSEVWNRNSDRVRKNEWNSPGWQEGGERFLKQRQQQCWNLDKWNGTAGQPHWGWRMAWGQMKINSDCHMCHSEKSGFHPLFS